MIRRILPFVLVAGVTASSFAADEAAPKDTQAKQPAQEAAAQPQSTLLDTAKFPAPLDQLVSNIAELEKTGYFTIADVQYMRNEQGDLAFVWKVKVTRRLTCRLAIMLLNELRDVRFYDTTEKSRFELHSTYMHYSPHLAPRAVDREMLRENEELQLWVIVEDTVIRMLNARRADTVVFGRPRERS
jgi:hypothetical protein